MSAPLLVMRGITKAFPGVLALADARLELAPGEVHVLLGENGAGKSTLMKVLCGAIAPDGGTVELDGQPVRPRTPAEAARLGLIMIHQELNLLGNLSVAQNVFLGCEPRRRGLIDDARMRAETRALLDRLRCTVDADALVSGLSVSQRQLVEIAKALRARPRVLVMDEPTAALAESEIRALFTVIRTLCATGVAVVYISHRLAEIFEIGVRITIMRDGRFVASRLLAETQADELIGMMVGRTIEEQIPKRQVALGEEVLRLDGIARQGVLRPISLALRRGEILGVGGLMGSGRTELARAVFGADPIDGGRVLIGGQPLERHGPRQAIAAGIGLLTEDRKQQGLVLGGSVTENISLASLDAFCRWGLLDLEGERARAASFVEQLRIRVAALAQPVALLSGGNQQKVVLAKWLAARCRVLILDEPTRGIDVGAKAEVYALIGELVAQGVAVLLISSDMPELLGLADRIAVMHEGALQGVLDRAEASQEAVMALALGRVARELRGAELPQMWLTE